MALPPLVDLTCKQVTELASAFMTPSGLVAADRARFEQHLHACTWCMDYMQQLAQTVHAARRLAHEAAPPDVARVLALFRSVARTEAAAPVPVSGATHGRLLHEVVGWREDGARRFAQAAYDHASARVHEVAAPAPDALHCLASAARHLPRGNVALAAFCAAMAVARQVGITRFDQAAYDAERRAQSALLAQDLALDRVLASRDCP